MEKKIFVFLVLLTGFALHSCATINKISDYPDRIILNISDSPATKVALTWRTNNLVNEPVVQIAKATVWTQFLDSIITLNAKSNEFTTDESVRVYNHSIVINGLSPDTKYIYRVGGDSIWSEWCQFATAKDTNEPFEFVFFGDPQNDHKDHITRIFREAYKTSPDAGFWLISGDIISEPEEKQISEFFFAGNPFFRLLPLVLTPGNHDRSYKKVNGEIVRNERGKKVRLDEIDEYWKSSFTLPENGLPGFEETSYYFDYQGVRIVMINSNDKLDEQADWLNNVLAENNNKWTIVSFHHPIYSAGRERDDDETRNAFMPIFDKHNVDLVLTGHDHAYARSFKLKNGIKVGENEQGTVYVVSVSGPKMYSVNTTFNEIMAKTGGNTQLFQVISVNGNKLSFKAQNVIGQVFDSFELKKDD